MKIAKLQAETREARGTRAAQRLRRQGRLPGVIYGHGQTPESVAVPAHDFSNLLEHGAHVVELDLKSGKRQVLIKDVQFDHLGAEPIHVDFALVDLTEQVHVSVPLEFRGTPVGTHEGGVLDHGLVDVEVACLVTEIPASIRVNVADMKLGELLHVRDLELPENITTVTPPEAIVCSVRARTAAAEVAEEEAEEEAPEQPEIIGRKEKEEETGADANK
jgi:large subunit ribosomal protein L25